MVERRKMYSDRGQEASSSVSLEVKFSRVWRSANLLENKFFEWENRWSAERRMNRANETNDRVICRRLTRVARHIFFFCFRLRDFISTE